MKKCAVSFALMLLVLFSAAASFAAPALEPFNYHEDFETRSLRAWASYPLWQDTAYDPNFRVNEIVPGDPNISIVQVVTPYTNVDNYAGAQKLFDIWLVPGSTVSLRYYLKTNMPVEYLKIRLAAGNRGAVDVTLDSPRTNGWEWATVSFGDFLAENTCLAGEAAIKVNALAVLAKIPDADPVMPIYLGIDDVTVKGAQQAAFKFDSPETCKLSEFRPYIAKDHYRKGDTFSLRGSWPVDAAKVTVAITPFTDSGKTVYEKELVREGEFWALKPFRLSFPDGMYRAILTAYCGKGGELAQTELTFVVAPDIAGKHPRLWFDTAKQGEVESRLKTDEFSSVYARMKKSADSWRERLPVDDIRYVADQFPDEYWLPTLGAWGQETVRSWRGAAEENALAYAFHHDREAGEYVVRLLERLATFPDWNHPWLAKRGRYNYHPTGVMAHKFALAYDLTYDLMTDYQRKIIRKALMEKLVIGSHRTYVEDDMVTCDTSNWVAHIVGGAVMCMASIYGDGDETMEPYFSGAIFKLWDLIVAVHGRDGSYGEGFSYNSYTNYTLQENLPSLENVFGIDLHGPLNGAWSEAVWSGFIKNKRTFDFGDSHQNVTGLWRWTWLVPKFNDPLLSWLHDYCQTSPTFFDALYQPDSVPKRDPFGENPVRVFRDVGTTVFKSGWDTDDFVFVMRTGPFYNHQHIDQGTFWLADRGQEFIIERHGSDYYDDQYYQSWYTQPVGHSTILIDNNHQSQRVGDHLAMAEGFHDHAFIAHFLDGENAAFTRGDIGRLYWGKVKSMQRNVLYLKPRTLIMLDTVEPADKDADVTLLYQTAHLDDITAGNAMSSIAKDGATLVIRHLAPGKRRVEAVETPHYLDTLLNEKPLVREGMLTVSARTSGAPLVVANILTTTPGGQPDIEATEGKGFVEGTADGRPFVFSTSPGAVYEAVDMATDALAVTNSGGTIFAAMCTVMRSGSALVIESDAPVTFERTGNTMKYYRCTAGTTAIGAPSKPGAVTVNGASVKNWRWDNERKAVVLELPEGEGTVAFR